MRYFYVVEMLQPILGLLKKTQTQKTPFKEGLSFLEDALHHPQKIF